MSGRYILGPDGQPVPEPHLLRWAAWFETADRTVRSTYLADGALWVSTVFLGLDHAFGNKPVLWETMVFTKATPVPDNLRALADSHFERYRSREDAIAGHEAVVAAIQGTLELWRNAVMPVRPTRRFDE